MLERTKYLVEKHWKKILSFLGVAGAADLVKEFMRHEAMSWLSERLGPLGSWVAMNPTAILTLALSFVLVSLFSIAMRDLSRPSLSQILDHTERPFNIPLRAGWTKGFVAVTISCFGLVIYGSHAYYTRSQVASPSVLQRSPQRIRWGPVDGRKAGITIEGATSEDNFIVWSILKSEVEKKLLPQVIQVPADCDVRVLPFRANETWIVGVVDRNDKTVAYIWFGPDPKHHWVFDGLVRVGMIQPDTGLNPVIWQTFQRYSDGSYVRQQ